jgi:predicted lipoprotein
MFRILFLMLAVVGLSSSSGQAAPAAAPEVVYTRLVAEVIVPGFDGLADRARRHQAAWTAYCRAPGAAEKALLMESFHALADAWAGIEMIRSGPAAEDFRHERFYFWPERKNAVDRGLTGLLNKPGSPEAADIAKESAAVQGLPALERLIFLDATQGKGPEEVLRCRLGEAISANAARIADEMASDWRSRPVAASPEARVALATDIVTFYATIKDTKVEAVIGKDQNEVKPRAAEFWRSGRTVRNILHNLEALERINTVLIPEAKEDVVLPFATRTATDIARSLPPDLSALAAGADRQKAVLLRDAVDAAEDRAAIEVPAALGVTIGFSSLDGD